MKDTVLWYRQPAENWNQALPIGNGKLGAMVFGHTIKERIQLNEDSVWSGGPMDRNNPQCLSALPKVRSCLKDGEVEKAHRLASYAMTGIPDSQRCYQTLGDLYITLNDTAGDIGEYRRELDLQTAVCTTSFQVGGVAFAREIFASYPDNVIVLRLRADQRGALNFHAKLMRDRFVDRCWAMDGHTIAFEGTNGGEDGIHFACMVRCLTKGGTLETAGEYLVVTGADEATLLLTAATAYRTPNPVALCTQVLAEAALKGYEQLCARHLQDYQACFARSALHLQSDAEGKALPTDERLARFAQDHGDIGLFALYYHYGRYLLIASSRPGSLPANLQGIWCSEMRPAWDSKYTININTEMNYWPAESCQLSDCHLPLFELLERMYLNGVHTAKSMYGVGGWVAHHNTDLWGDTAPQDTYLPATFWVMGAAWLCTHIWEHYSYTLDQAFLAKHFYLLEDACRFFLDYLMQDAAGRWIITPTLSPENTYIHRASGKPTQLCEGCAMDSQILQHLFSSTVEACAVLQTKPELAKELSERLEHIPTPQIGSDGRLMEWLEEYVEIEPGHRHISHLYALFPGREIDFERTPALCQAARKTLEQRLAHGGGHTGWSRAWIINMWAFLQDASAAQENLEQLLIHSTLPNLLDNHPPFQIDGNFGATAGIANLLLQCDDHLLKVLPALPLNWTDGCMQGLCAKGGLTLDIHWQQGMLHKVSILASQPYEGQLAYGAKRIPVRLSAGQKIDLTL